MKIEENRVELVAATDANAIEKNEFRRGMGRSSSIFTLVRPEFNARRADRTLSRGKGLEGGTDSPQTNGKKLPPKHLLRMRRGQLRWTFAIKGAVCGFSLCLAQH